VRRLSDDNRSVLAMAYDIQDDLAIIANSLKLLPRWSYREYWEHWEQIYESFAGFYFASKMWLVVDTLHPGTKDDRHQIHEACRYLLWFFDRPELADHIDELAGFAGGTAGHFGRRWIETICAAAWRVLLDTVDSLPEGIDLSAEQIKESLEPRGAN
jgi:hypothetical protein